MFLISEPFQADFKFGNVFGKGAMNGWCEQLSNFGGFSCLSEHYGAGELSRIQSSTRIVSEAKLSGNDGVFQEIRKLDGSKPLQCLQCLQFLQCLHDIIEKE